MKDNNTIQTLTAAQTALEKGDLEQAEHRFRELLDSEPHNLHALSGMGILHYQLGNSKKAIGFFLEALESNTRPDSYALTKLHDNSLTNTDKATLLLYLGIALRTIGNHKDAIETLQRAYSILPNSPDIILNLGQLHFELEQFDEAIGCFKLLTELQPRNASAWLTLGYILHIRGFFKDQVNGICANESPESFELCASKSQTLSNSDFDNEKFEETLAALKTAMQLDNASPDACFYIAETLRKSEKFQESLPYYQRLLQIGNEWPQAVLNYGKSLLATGNFEYGWDALEFRFAAEFGTWSTHLLPRWAKESGEVGNNSESDSVSKNILAYAEGGVASEIMFASCLPDLINEVGHCVVECESSLHQLFRRSFPRATIVGSVHGDVGKPTKTSESDSVEGEVGQSSSNMNSKKDNAWGIEIDEQVAFGSLPRYFRKGYDDFPLRKSYLVPDRDKVCHWMNRLASLGNMPKIGVLWRGCWTSESARQCTLPLGELKNILLSHQGDSAWINLQNGSWQRDFENFNRNVSIRLHRFGEVFQYDLDSMAALLTSLDLVITPPGYVSHLAGALGVKTWLVLPSGSDWRWNLGKSESLWHPTMRVFRKDKERGWDILFEEIGLELSRFLGAFRVQSGSVSGGQVVDRSEPTIIKFPSQLPSQINSNLTTAPNIHPIYKLKKAS
ncbi:MAG: tetratricopeptide repeat protein [Planctomycetaceae bacterium]|jgi:tetratricopeptide (TPR) repeat protein|nr:tetratricopeptide repeat protein [Planctomycetaceae bacterium]